ncbi:hypothetical protein NPJ82_09345 [Sphingomonas sp. NY01]|uniref:hypothetical protein n=1 Tax=Sphingomonas sp. NY01 TaxID=2968057 RepID=UPI00315DF03F
MISLPTPVVDHYHVPDSFSSRPAMHLPPRFVLIIEGTVYGVTRGGIATAPTFAYLIERLLSGHAIADEALEHYGLRVWIEPDTDQSCDGPDVLYDARSGKGCG